MKTTDSAYKNEFQSFAFDFLTDNGFASYFSENYIIVPGLCDVHVHFREPGFLYKETIKSGCRAAAHGGYTAVCSMPNLNPVPDSLKNLKPQLDAIEKSAEIKVIPYGAVTVGESGRELSDMKGMAEYVCAFSDDGKGVQREDIMRQAMLEARSLGKIIAAHCEDNTLLRGGYIHDGEYARQHGHRGICSESEFRQIERDIKLSKETGCAYHVCHISAKESVDLIRDAKAEGVNITCETAPHYLVLCDDNLEEDGRFKMNPPLRGKADREALLRGIADGTIDMVATDHAPHSAEEKSKPVTEAPSGIIGLETSLALGITSLVKPGHLSMLELLEKMTINPARLYHMPYGTISEGAAADFVIFDPDEKWVPCEYASKSSNTPFTGMELTGKVKYTVCGGNVIYSDK